VEGYALHADVGFPISHACARTDGHAIDPTWDSPVVIWSSPFYSMGAVVLEARIALIISAFLMAITIERFSCSKMDLPMMLLLTCCDKLMSIPNLFVQTNPTGIN
jgi:hypothetical protein